MVDRGDGDGGFVADGEFVVSGGHGAVLFELVDAALSHPLVGHLKMAVRRILNQYLR